MEQLLEMLNRLEDAERLLKTSYSPRLVIGLDGSVFVGWKDQHESRSNIYAANNPIGNIKDSPDVLVKKLEDWALVAYESKNNYVG